MKAFTLAVPSCAVLLLTAPAARAVTIDSTLSREVFQSALTAGNLVGQNFDALAPGMIVNTINGVTYSASQGHAVVTNEFLATTPPNGLGSTSFGYFASTESAVISFATPVTAFAIDINTFADSPGGDYVAALNNGSTVDSRPVFFGDTSIGEFFGFTSDTPFSGVTISLAANAGAGEPSTHTLDYTLDTLIYGEANNVVHSVPEPSTWGFLASGLGLLLAAHELRRHLQKSSKNGVTGQTSRSGTS
jgi:hypothetical protein